MPENLFHPAALLPAVNAPDGRGVMWDEIFFGDESDVFPPGGARLAPNAHGKVVVSGGEVGRDLNKLKSPGRDGHRIVDKGLKPASFQIKLSVWDDDGYAFIEKWTPRFQARKRLTERSPIRIQYPSLRQIDVGQMVVEKFSPLEPTGIQGMMSMTLHCIEFTAPVQRRSNVTRTVAPVSPQVASALFDPFGGGLAGRINQPANVLNFTPNTNP